MFTSEILLPSSIFTSVSVNETSGIYGVLLLLHFANASWTPASIRSLLMISNRRLLRQTTQNTGGMERKISAFASFTWFRSLHVEGNRRWVFCLLDENAYIEWPVFLFSHIMDFRRNFKVLHSFRNLSKQFLGCLANTSLEIFLNLQFTILSILLHSIIFCYLGKWLGFLSLQKSQVHS